MACKYGSHRVLEPKGVLPQPALRLDNDFSKISTAGDPLEFARTGRGSGPRAV